MDRQFARKGDPPVAVGLLRAVLAARGHASDAVCDTVADAPRQQLDSRGPPELE